MPTALLLLSFVSSVLSEYIPVAGRQDARQFESSSVPSTSHLTVVRPLFGGADAPLNSAASTYFSSNRSAYEHDGDSAYMHIHSWAKREVEKGSTEFAVFACLIPVLVILSGIFAGLTLGYMSLDETQLNVLSISGTPKQREYANKIKPIRKNGHLLLVTLLLANMITNETLPVISDPVLGGGLQSVVVSTTLIVLFAEIIPQSICTRHGLYIGAKCAGGVRALIWIFSIIAWPVAKLLELLLGPHHGIIYRRAELKELIAMHGAENPLGGDLKSNTVTIIGATLDLQDKTVRQAMTPIDRAFMLHIDAKLDYDTLHRVCATGHSRIPVYEEVELTVPAHVAAIAAEMGFGDGSQLATPAKKSIDGESLVRTKVKKIIGILLVKHCVLLDPEDAVPIRKMRLIKVPFVPQNEPLLGILDHFQEGRCHMAIVSRLSVERAQSIKKEVHKGLTQRLFGGFHGDSASDSSSDASDDEDENDNSNDLDLAHENTNGEQTVVDETGTAGKDSLKESVKVKFAKTSGFHRMHKRRRYVRRRSIHTGQSGHGDLEKGDPEAEAKREKVYKEKKSVEKEMRRSALEQTMPADAVLSKKNAEEYLASQGIDPAIMPLGIITLEDVLEELIGEEIYDEFDVEGSGAHSQSFVPPGAHPHQQQPTKPDLARKNSAPELSTIDTRSGSPPMITPSTSGAGWSRRSSLGIAMPRPIALPNLRNIAFLRSRSAPPTPRDQPETLPVPPRTPSSGVATPAVGVEHIETGDAHPPMVTTSSEGPSHQLPQIIESPWGSEGRSQPMNVVGPTFSVEKQLSGSGAVSRNPSQRRGQAKTPSSVSSPVVNQPLAAIAVPPLALTSESRSASPAPSLEAAILHAKGRRATTAISGSRSGASGSGVESDATSRTVTPTEHRGRMKGAFKSSPLTPLGADASVVVAEEIRKEKERRRERERERESETTN